MKKLFLFILMVLINWTYAQETLYYRDLINKAELSSKDANIFLKRVSTDYQKTKLPIFMALSGVGNFFLAKHSYNPIHKISYFNKGKKMLDDAITKDNKNVEMRYLRYLSQKKIPKILGYYKNIEEDKKYILTHYQSSKDEALIKEIKKHFKLK